MSGAETARRRVVQRRIGDAEMALPQERCGWARIIVPQLNVLFNNVTSAYCF